MMISRERSGEMNSRAIEPVSRSRDMLSEVSMADIISRMTATRPGMKKNWLRASGLK